MHSEKKRRITFIVSLVTVAVLIPAVILVSYCLGDRRYYITSLIVTVLSMVPFFVSFEGSRPDARYLAVLAVMTALAVASRAAFAWAANFKPMAGIIIITAASFGPQSGFMCGALAMIVSNIIFGQGPWTSWQMLCYGLIGFIAGFLGKGRIISERHAIRSGIIGFILVFVLSAAILDTCSVFYFGLDISPAAAAAVYAAGVPVNTTNALASALCVFLLIKPLSLAIRRVRVKYDI